MADPRARFVNGSGKEYVTVCLSEIRKEMQCPICLGIIRKTRTVMECLHRFCRECIDKSMRLGNNECPACRTHCASRRSLRDDPNFDALIAALYPDVDKYEEEELMLLEEENRKNKQIQASIAETFKRQSEAAARRRTTAKVTAAAIVRKAHGKFRHVKNRNRGPSQARGNRTNGPTLYGSSSPQEEDKDIVRIDPPSSQPQDDVSRDAAELNEPPKEAKKEISKDRAGWRKRRRPRHVEPANSEEERNGTTVRVEENPPDEQKPETQNLQETSPANRSGLITWARAGARSQTRYSLGTSIPGGRNANRCIRASALLDFLTSASRKDNEEEYDIHLHLQPLEASDEEDVLPSLERPYMCCPPNMTVQYLCKHLLARLPQARGGELELLVERMSNTVSDHVQPGRGPSVRLNKLAKVNKQLAQRILEPLESKDTLQYVLSSCWDKDGNLELLYRLKNEW